jgi:hypothetical protein
VSVDIRVETSEYKSEPLPPDTGCSVEFWNWWKIGDYTKTFLKPQGQY